MICDFRHSFNAEKAFCQHCRQQYYNELLKIQKNEDKNVIDSKLIIRFSQRTSFVLMKPTVSKFICIYSKTEAITFTVSKKRIL